MRNLEDLLLPDDGGLARPTPQPPQPVPVEHSEAMEVAEDGVEAAQAPQKVEVPVSNLFDETSEAEEAEDDEAAAPLPLPAPPLPPPPRRSRSAS